MSGFPTATLFPRVPIVKIVLITPYGGANLGDAAIQEAVIHNLRARMSGIDIRMATLAPERTEALHGVPSFPLTALEIPFYSEGILARPPPQQPSHANAEPAAAGAPSLLSRAKALLRKMPWLFHTLRSGKQALRACSRLPRLLYREMRHLIAAFRFARGANYFIVSGGGQIDDYWGGPWGHPYTLMKWSILAHLVGARFVFLSVGVCSLQSALSRHFVKSALRRAAYRSYRDEASKRLLSYLPFTLDDPVCPDLAFSFPLARTQLQPSQPGKGQPRKGLIVGISPIAYLRSNWPRQDGSTYDAYMLALTEFTTGLIRRGYAVVLFSSDGADWHPVHEMRDALLATPGVNRDNLSSVLPATVDELFAVLARVDVVVASRLHGILLSHLAHKPVVAISYDRKVDTHMAYMEQTPHRLDIHSVDATAIDEVFQDFLEQTEKSSRSVSASSARLSGLVASQYDTIIQV